MRVVQSHQRGPAQAPYLGAQASPNARTWLVAGASRHPLRRQAAPHQTLHRRTVTTTSPGNSNHQQDGHPASLAVIGWVICPIPAIALDVDHRCVQLRSSTCRRSLSRSDGVTPIKRTLPLGHPQLTAAETDRRTPCDCSDFPRTLQGGSKDGAFHFPTCVLPRSFRDCPRPPRSHNVRCAWPPPSAAVVEIAAAGRSCLRELIQLAMHSRRVGTFPKNRTKTTLRTVIRRVFARMFQLFTMCAPSGVAQPAMARQSTSWPRLSCRQRSATAGVGVDGIGVCCCGSRRADTTIRVMKNTWPDLPHTVPTHALRDIECAADAGRRAGRHRRQPR